MNNSKKYQIHVVTYTKDKETDDKIYNLCKPSRVAAYVKAYTSDFPGWYIIDNKEGKKLLEKLAALIPDEDEKQPLNTQELFARYIVLSSKGRKSADEKAEMAALAAQLG